jgi:hypothetical protein
MDAKEKLAEKMLAGLKEAPALIGLDGFVDQIVGVVDKRTDAEHYTRIKTMSEYSKRIAGGSGLSCNIEIVPIKQKLGGNGPIFANALKKQNMKVTYIGSVGATAVHPIFAELSDGSRMIGLEEPGQTSAYEFTDGKIIVSMVQHFKNITWEKITQTIGMDEFVRIFEASSLIGFENWTMIPNMSEVWLNVIERVLPALTVPPREKTVFFDLADPEKRDGPDIRKALDLIGRFTGAGFQTILGLNKKEACEIYELYCGGIGDYRSVPLKQLTLDLKEALNIKCLVIHPVDAASCALDGGYCCVAGPYCADPVLTTGAGDNFNAGFVTGWINGFDAEECLLCGAAASGFYVRRGRSPETAELAQFLLDWKKERI